MDEQTRKIIEAFAKMRAKVDPDEILLARKVRTPEGVEKYDQPIGTIITKDMIEKAAKKASQAATSSLKKDIGAGGQGSTSSSGTASPSASPNIPSVTPSGKPNAPVKGSTGVPGGQTSADIKQFFVSQGVNNPSEANMGWVQKNDGKWFMQKYANGKVISETPLDPQQQNAVEVMAAKGFVTPGFIPDPEPESEEQSLTKKITDAFSEGKSPSDPDVKAMIQKLAEKGEKPEEGKADGFKEAKPSTEGKPKSESKEAAKPEGKTVEINGKQVKVGRYSRPKGFAKAFLIVNEDGTIEYEDKKGARKKITAKSFENHQGLGMNKFLTPDTGPIKKDEHFEDGKLVKDSGSASAPEPAKVAPMKTPEAAPKPAPAAEKPAQEAPKSVPGGESLKSAASTSFKLKPDNESAVVKPLAPEEPKTVKIGNLTVKPGRYARPKGFAKAFLIVHPDGTAEYENKKGERKKIGPKSFEGHWNLGMSKFLTSDTGAIKKGDSYEDGKLVEDKTDSKPATVSPPAPKPVQPPAEPKKETPKVEGPAVDFVIKGKKVDSLPAGTKIYHAKYATAETAGLKYAKTPDGTWHIGDAAGLHLLTGDIALKNANTKSNNGSWTQESNDSKSTSSVLDAAKNASAQLKAKQDAKTKIITLGDDTEVQVPADSDVYVTKNFKDSDTAKVIYYKKDGEWWRSGLWSGSKKLLNQDEIDLDVKDGDLVLWAKHSSKSEDGSKETPAKTFKLSVGKGLSEKTYDIPEGSQLYVIANSENLDAADLTTIWVKHPNGDWWRATTNKYSKGIFQKDYQDDVDEGVYVPWNKSPNAPEKKAEPVAAPSKSKNITISSVINPSASKEFDIPQDAEVYVPKHLANKPELTKAYVKTGDSWHSYSFLGEKTPLEPSHGSTLESYIKSGKYAKWDGQTTTKKVSVRNAEKSESVDVPEGSKVYVPSVSKDKESQKFVYVQYPSGEWWKLGVATGFKQQADLTAKQLDGYKDDNTLVEWSKYASAKPEDKTDGSFYVLIKGNKIAAFPKDSKVYFMPHHSSDDATVKFVQEPDGKWSAVTPQGAQTATKAESDAATNALANNLFKQDTISAKDGKLLPGDDGTAAGPELSEADKASAEISSPEPSTVDVKSVKISGMDIKPGKYSIGKGFAKAFLLVHPDGTTEYQNKAGQKKKLTPAAFKKNWDAGMNKFAGPLDTVAASTKPATKTVQPTNIGGPKPGKYDFMPFGQQFEKKSVLEVFEDGSSIFEIPGTGAKGVPANADGTLSTLKSGMVVDEYGNSVVLPGLPKPDKVHLFGSTDGVSIADLELLRNNLASGKPGIMTMVKSVAPDIDVAKFFAYQKAMYPGVSDSSRKSFIKAIDEMLHAAKTKQTDASSVAAVPSVTKGMFKFDDKGFAILPDEAKSLLNSNFNYFSTPEQNAKLKELSQGVGDGKAIVSAPSKMNEYTKASWMEAFMAGDFKKMYAYENNSGMKMSPQHPGAPGNEDTHKITWAPAVPGELPAGQKPDGKWTFDTYNMTPEEIDNYLIAANMGFPQYLTASNKKYWVTYHVSGNKAAVDKLSLKAKKNHDSYPNDVYSKPLVWTDGVKPKTAYDEYLEAGYAVDSWSGAALKAYVEDFPEAIPEKDKGKDSYYQAKNIQNHLDTLAAEKAAKEAAELAEKLKPKFKKAAGFSVSGGHHEAMVLEDQFGKKWVYKPRDDKDIFLADVEQASHELARMWGFKTSKSFITEFDGRKGHVQEMFDAEKDLSSVSMSELNPSQVTDLAKEHLLDWALDNDDSWGANVLMLKNGSLVGIDKGRAFASIGHWNGLSADSSAHVHMPLVYTDLYKAIQDKTISQETANDAYFSVLKQAKKMQALSDQRMTEQLEAAFANRTNWATTGGPGNKEAAIEAALKRKNSLVEDMEKLWGRVFEKAGYDKPEAPNNVVSNPEDQDIHLGVTPAALDQAKANGSYGTSVFFAGPEIEDSHVLLFHAQSKSGRDTLNAEFKVRENTDAFKDMEQWLKNNAVKVDNAYGFTPGNMKQTLPNEEDYFQKIIMGVKTISAHAQDGQYNEGSLNGMSWVKNTLKNFVDEYDDKMANPISQAALVKQYKDPKSYYDMAQKYLGYITKAEEHKAMGTKSAPGEFTQYEWTPPKKEEPDNLINEGVKVELRPATSAKAVINGVPKFEEDGSLKHKHGYTQDGNPGSMYLVTLPTGETIEFRGNTTGTPAAQKGLVRWRTAAGADEAASIERIRAQMATMGLEMNDASEDDLELYYWRHLAAIMNDRADSKVSPGVTLKSTPKYKKFQAAKPVETAKMTPSEELEAWKDAFANITSRNQIDEFVGAGGHLPKFSHFHLKDPTKYAGNPYWERFDVADEWQDKELPSGSFYDNSHAKYIVDTGGMMATETRLRTLGMWKDGMSSSSDQGHGSSQFVFIRQNLEVKPSTNEYELMGVYYNPKILKRTHNYSFSGDQFGEMSLKSQQAYFDFDEMTKHKSGSNEIMVKHATSLLDDIEIITFTDEGLRNQMIKAMKDMGLDEIRGVPVEMRFVMRNKKDILAAQKAAKEAWKK